LKPRWPGFEFRGRTFVEGFDCLLYGHFERASSMDPAKSLGCHTSFFSRVANFKAKCHDLRPPSGDRPHLHLHCVGLRGVVNFRRKQRGDSRDGPRSDHGSVISAGHVHIRIDRSRHASSI
jgi:hypothetical protein